MITVFFFVAAIFLAFVALAACLDPAVSWRRRIATALSVFDPKGGPR